jgi:hypothetical protein
LADHSQVCKRLSQMLVGEQWLVQS